MFPCSLCSRFSSSQLFPGTPLSHCDMCSQGHFISVEGPLWRWLPILHHSEAQEQCKVCLLHCYPAMQEESLQISPAHSVAFLPVFPFLKQVPFCSPDWLLAIEPRLFCRLLLGQPPERWDYRSVWPYPASTMHPMLTGTLGCSGG